MTRYHSSCIELIRMHSVMFQLVGLIISHQYELYLLLNSHFQADIIKNDTYFFWVKAKNIYIIFLVLLKRKSVLFFSNRGLGINPQKYFSSIFFKGKKLEKRVCGYPYTVLVIHLSLLHVIPVQYHSFLFSPKHFYFWV